MLIIPHRHVSNYFELTPEERIAMFELLEDTKLLLDKERKPDGFNIGINDGERPDRRFGTCMPISSHAIQMIWLIQKRSPSGDTSKTEILIDVGK